MNSAENMKQLLMQDIDSLIAQPELYAKDPVRDFTRNRKLPAKTVMLFQIAMERDTMNRELIKYFDYALDTPSASAFYQQRRKLRPETFSLLFHAFNSHFIPTLYKEKYIPLAVDGSGFSMFREPDNKETFRPPSGKKAVSSSGT